MRSWEQSQAPFLHNYCWSQESLLALLKSDEDRGLSWWTSWKTDWNSWCQVLLAPFPILPFEWPIAGSDTNYLKLGQTSQIKSTGLHMTALMLKTSHMLKRPQAAGPPDQLAEHLSRFNRATDHLRELNQVKLSGSIEFKLPEVWSFAIGNRYNSEPFEGRDPWGDIWAGSECEVSGDGMMLAPPGYVVCQQAQSFMAWAGFYESWCPGFYWDLIILFKWVTSDLPHLWGF